QRAQLLCVSLGERLDDGSEGSPRTGGKGQRIEAGVGGTNGGNAGACRRQDGRANAARSVDRERGALAGGSAGIGQRDYVVIARLSGRCITKARRVAGGR